MTTEKLITSAEYLTLNAVSNRLKAAITDILTKKEDVPGIIAARLLVEEMMERGH